MTELTSAQIAGMIDHALLKPEMTRAEVKEGCELAAKYHTASVCVKGNDVAYCTELLKDSGVLVGTVVGFPHGNAVTSAKVKETEVALSQGAKEIDVVLPIGLVKSGEYEYVRHEISEVLAAVRRFDGLLKVIFENCYLTREEIIRCCEICSELDVDFVKTSTGFGIYGARVEDVALMRAHTKPSIQIKASGGIRSLDDFLALHEAGATRMGASATAAIVDEAKRRGM